MSPRGFSLLELVFVLVALAVLASGLALPVAAQVQARRLDETRRVLEEARDALLGFAAANGRLPCPATPASGGHEAFAPGGDASNGACADFHGGFLPGAALGLAGLDPQGFVRDPWAGPGERIRYAVSGGGSVLNGVRDPLTRANGLQRATLPAIGAANGFLVLCADGAGATATGCGPASAQLTRRAAFIVWSAGPNATAAPAPGSDEARNRDGDAVFVSRERNAAGFDDLLVWVPVHLLTHRLLSAGRLP